MRILFESKRGFDEVFAQASIEETERRLPRRGLREIMRFGHLPLLKTISRGNKICDATIDRVFAMELAEADGRSQIALLQRRREELHEKWVKEKHLGEVDLREYWEALSEISNHRQDSNFVNLVDHVRAYRMVMAVLGRLVDYAGLFERDLYFATLALLDRSKLRPEGFFEESVKDKENGLKLFYEGRIIFALRHLKKNGQEAADILKEMAKHFTEVWARTRNTITDIRNNLAHLNMLQGAAPTPQLTHWVNQTRQLMAYDRKLKNAVSKSVMELIAREGIELRWMKIEGKAHDLADAELSSRCAKHLGGKELTLADKGPKRKTLFLQETLHGDSCVAMVAAAFDGKMRRTASIAENLSKVDWKASGEKKGSR